MRRFTLTVTILPDSIHKYCCFHEPYTGTSHCESQRGLLAFGISIWLNLRLFHLVLSALNWSPRALTTGT